MNKHFNHSPFVHSVWVPFIGQRFKNPYTIRTKSGEELIAMPNGIGWQGPNQRSIEDSDIVEIKALPDGVGPKPNCVGGYRIARDIEYFGPNFPVWCGRKDGFIYESEVPEGKQILPIRVMGYRSKKSEDKTVRVYITQGMLVEQNDTNPTIEVIQKYANIPGFWLDDEVEIIPHDEVVTSTYWVAKYLDAVAKNPAAYEAIFFLKDELKLPPNQYVHMFDYVMDMWNKDSEDFCRQMRQMHSADKKNEIRWKHYFAVKKIFKQNLRNVLAAPEHDRTFDIDILNLSNFLKNPLVKPKQLEIPKEWK